MTRMRACAMRMDGRLLALAAALLLAAVVMPGLSLAATQNVTWINVTNAAANGNTLTKTGGCAGCQDAGASSQQQIASGDGFVEFTVVDPAKLRFLGLTSGGAKNVDDLAFALRVQTGMVEVREHNQYKANSPVAANDKLRIAIEGGKVKYYKNGAVFYTSDAAPQYPLVVITALLDSGAEVTNVVISSAG